jgi:poly-gamma-glutamate synthesis protein (capsule biosynthesis protein)
MNKHSQISIILTTLLVVAFGWGSAYLVINGIRAMNSGDVLVETDPQKALTIAANVVNPAVPEKEASNKITIMVAGDMMFDRGIRAIGERDGYDSLFDSSVTTLFKKADIVAANLEGPITSNPSKTLVDGKIAEPLIFTFSPKVRTAIKNAGITIVGLANNHVDNFGFLGYMETQDWLQDAGIPWYGNPWNSTSTKMSREKLTNDKSPIATVVTKNGIKVAFVGYHSFQLGIDRVIAEIKRVSGPDVFTIVVPHWGEEYTATSSEKMRSQAKAFIAAGADAIIGAHPHVVMNQEWMNGVPVVYSVGNLLFDQYFSPQVMTGNIIELHVSKDASGVHLESMNVHENYLIKGKGVSLEQ